MIASATTSTQLLPATGDRRLSHINHLSKITCSAIVVSFVFVVLLALPRNSGVLNLSTMEAEFLARNEGASALCAEALSKLENASGGDTIFQDIHDGDMKKVHYDDTRLIIEPFKNDETWIVVTGSPDDICSFSVDFQVPGKPGPPPVPLRLQLVSVKSLETVTKEATSIMAVFYDPTGTLAEPEMPLNVWYGTSI
mmetsp:Transcript_17978/g.23831  ORF Transcript_17978/g.23831 Transcript_17978/m.23831 type:complete len:196 (-) Transcript_17978:49-636(-)